MLVGHNNVIFGTSLLSIIALYLNGSTLKIVKMITNVAEEIIFLCTLWRCGFVLKRLYLFEHEQC